MSAGSAGHDRGNPLPDTVLVVPCFDEAARLCDDAFAEFVAANPGAELLFVDDGSRDATGSRLARLVARDPKRMSLLALPRNHGKAAAVRLGMLRAFDRAPRYVGYWDADLSTPLDEVRDLAAELEADPDLQIVIGSRIMMLGRAIERRTLRHYAGRVMATAASMTLALPVYDTQCGAKLFRAGSETCALFEEPFLSTWLFDVEILARLMAARRRSGGPGAEVVVREHALRTWRDVPGSRVRPRDFFIGLWQLLRIRRRYLSPRPAGT